jgi:hypothetical protein
MMLRLLGYLLRAGTLVKRGEERDALSQVSAELIRLDPPYRVTSPERAGRPSGS